MKAPRLAGLAIALAVPFLAVPSLARAEPRHAFAIPRGPLAATIIAIGQAGRVTIGLGDARLGRLEANPVSGSMTVPAALREALAGTAANFVETDSTSFRIVARAPSRPFRRAKPPSAPATVAAAPTGTIVVIGSKRAAPLSDYIGTVSIIDSGALNPGQRLDGSRALVQALPILSSTDLGPGRDKLFIRGIADSSFNGPTQATAGQYLGDVRLNYNAPDPDLALYDIRSVEVLEGPQGTLYGAGSLGGVIRIEPVEPDLAQARYTLTGALSSPAHGAIGGDGAAIANTPIVTDRLGLRIVAYGGIEAGYIDDPSRDLSDINRTSSWGARATLRYRPSPDWTIDLGGVTQNINSRDGQYATRGLPAYQRDSVIAQPFDNDYALTSLTVRHDAGAARLTSATSAVFQDVTSVYDASASPGAPRRYVEHHRIRLYTDETRLSGDLADGGGWVAGIELLHSADDLGRSLGPPGGADALSGTGNGIDQVSLFGEATIALTHGLLATGGGRISYSRSTSSVLDAPNDTEGSRPHDVVALPSAGLLWKPAPGWQAYVRYQEGNRPGGLSVQMTGTTRFRSDSLATWEAGVRFGGPGGRLSAHIAASLAHWDDIQADLVDAAGLPYTTNIGSGRIKGIEAGVSWRAIARLTFDGAIFADDSDLSRPAPAFGGEKDASLPNIADMTAHLAAHYETRLLGRPISLSLSSDYVGHSRLGVGPLLDLRQGGYVDTAAGIVMRLKAWTVALDASNLLDSRRNMFSLGDPFGVTAGTQITPQPPRTIRASATISF